MEQTADGGKNKNEGFFQKYLFPIILAVIAIVAIIIFAVNRGDNNTSVSDDSNQNQEQNQSSDNTSTDSDNDSDSDTTTSPSDIRGNVTAKGTLRNSDNLSRGNLMVESSTGKVYISTKRDFSDLLDKEVTLQADGTINNFTFLGFAEGNGTVAGTDTTARGGGDTEIPTTEVSNISFRGNLQNSDNAAKGNYIIVSGNTKVYLKSVRDYSSLIGSDVRLTASGTLSSFTQAKLAKI